MLGWAAPGRQAHQLLELGRRAVDVQADGIPCLQSKRSDGRRRADQPFDLRLVDTLPIALKRIEVQKDRQLERCRRLVHAGLERPGAGCCRPVYILERVVGVVIADADGPQRVADELARAHLAERMAGREAELFERQQARIDHQAGALGELTDAAIEAERVAGLELCRAKAVGTAGQAAHPIAPGQCLVPAQTGRAMQQLASVAVEPEIGAGDRQPGWDHVANVEHGQRQRLAVRDPNRQLDLIAGEGACMTELALVTDPHERPAIPQPRHSRSEQQQRADQRQQSLP